MPILLFCCIVAAWFVSLEPFNKSISAMTNLNTACQEEEILSRTRKAIFGDTKPADVRVTGKTTQFNLESQFVFEQASDGQYLREMSGKLSWAIGFDGSTAWENDWMNATRLLEFTDRDRTHLINLIQFGGWLLVKDYLEIEVDPEQSTAQYTALEIRFSSKHKSAVLLIDSQTNLPHTLTYSSADQEEKITFGDYRDIQGRQIPFKTKLEIADNTYEDTVTDVNFSRVTKDLSPVPTDFSGVRFDVQQKELNIKRAQSGHVLVNLSFNEHEPVWFIFDTGAGGTVVDRSLAKQLKLKELGSVVLVSMLGKEQSRFVQMEDIDFGPVKIDKIYGVDMDLSMLEPVLGEKISGIVGYDLFAKSIVEIDLSNDKVSVFDPATYRDESVDWKQLQLDRRLPLIPASMNDYPEELFRIDVGASGLFFSNVVFHYDYTKAEALDEKFGESKFTLVPPHDFMTGKIERFQVAGKVFESPEVGFTVSDTAPFNEFYSKGNIGVEFLKPFKIILDYPGRRIAIQKISSD